MTPSIFSASSSGLFGAHRSNALGISDPSAIPYSKSLLPNGPSLLTDMDSDDSNRYRIWAAFFALQAWAEWFRQVAIWQKVCKAREDSGEVVATPVNKPERVGCCDVKDTVVEADTRQDGVSQDEPRTVSAVGATSPPESSLSTSPIDTAKTALVYKQAEFYREQKQFDAKVYEWYTALSTAGTVSQIVLFCMVQPAPVLVIPTIVGAGLLYRYVSKGDKELRLRLGAIDDEDVIRHGRFSKGLSSFRDVLAIVGSALYVAAQTTSVSAATAAAIFDPASLIIAGSVIAMLTPLIWYLAKQRVNKQFDKESFATNYGARMYTSAVDGLYMGATCSAMAIVFGALVNPGFLVSAAAVVVTMVSCCVVKSVLEASKIGLKGTAAEKYINSVDKGITSFFKSGKNMWAVGLLGVLITAAVLPQLAPIAAVGLLGMCLRSGYNSAKASSYENPEVNAMARQWVGDFPEKTPQTEQSALIAYAASGQSVFEPSSLTSLPLVGERKAVTNAMSTCTK